MKKETFNELQKSMEQALAHSKGKLTLRTKKLSLPQKVDGFSPKEILRLRKRLGTSQAVFARYLNVSTTTAIKWETGRRKPTGTALRLLDIVRRKPGILEALYAD